MIRYLIALLLIATPALAEPATISRAECQQLIKHRPAPDVAYQPGVDAHGKEVVGADLNKGPIIGDNITIPLTINLQREYGIPMGATRGSDATVGVITVDNNKAYFNGQPLDGPDQENLEVLCLKETR